MSKRGHKGLSAEDREQWARLKRTVRPMNPSPKLKPFAPKGVPDPGPEPTAKASTLPDFTVGSRARSSGSVTAEAAAHVLKSSSPIDRRTLTRMRRGKTKPEARIDLHGMTQAQALPALTGFILRAAADGKRLVLVITGKGRDRDDGGPIPERSGVLRHNLPHWLNSGPMSGLVLDVVESHQRHGGGGAFYVYLRRRR